MNDYWILLAFAIIFLYYINTYVSTDDMADDMADDVKLLQKSSKGIEHQKYQKYYTYENKLCGYNQAQLDKTRGELVPNDAGHSFYTTYDYDNQHKSQVDFCKQKCEDNPRCGTFVTNFQTNQCHINEKIKNNNLTCTESKNSDSYVRDRTLCEHEKMQHWYCNKDFGHRYWN